MPLPKMVDVFYACQALHISYRTLLRWVHAGKIRSAQPGRKLLIPEDEIARLLALRPLKQL